jgi:hypothetical protein
MLLRALLKRASNNFAQTTKVAIVNQPFVSQFKENIKILSHNNKLLFDFLQTTRLADV